MGKRKPRSTAIGTLSAEVLAALRAPQTGFSGIEKPLDEDGVQPGISNSWLAPVAPAAGKFDATTLVETYAHESEVPDRLKKYFAQRYRCFSRYDEGCLLDETGWYSVTPEAVADKIAERCACDVVLDAFCGVGGNAIAFAKTCHRVIALDTSPVRLALAKHNAAIYGVDDRIEFVLADYISFANTYLSLPQEHRKIDVVFLSPPWGGPGYMTTPSTDDVSGSTAIIPREYSLFEMQPIPGSDLFTLTRQITRNVAFFLPRNSSLSEISSLLGDSTTEKIEVEEEWMGSKLKMLTCYFGGLADGQSDLFK